MANSFPFQKRVLVLCLCGSGFASYRIHLYGDSFVGRQTGLRQPEMKQKFVEPHGEGKSIMSFEEDQFRLPVLTTKEGDSDVQGKIREINELDIQRFIEKQSNEAESSVLIASVPFDEHISSNKDKNQNIVVKKKASQKSHGIANTKAKAPHVKKLEPSLFDDSLIEDDKKICLVHIGKTAGSTLGCLLGFDYSCGENDEYIRDSMLTKYTTRILHTFHNDCNNESSNFAYYLFTTRNPLKRIQSWFTYERPGAYWAPAKEYMQTVKLYKECNFTTLSDLGESLALGMQQPTKSTLCQNRAYLAITGKVAYSRHNHLNYQYYYEEVKDPENNSILAVRTEHMEYDMKQIEDNILGGNSSVIEQHFGSKKTKQNVSPKTDRDGQLSDTARRYICKALCQEIQIYKEIIRRAENLSPDDVTLSMQELQESCPIEAVRDACP